MYQVVTSSVLQNTAEASQSVPCVDLSKTCGVLPTFIGKEVAVAASNIKASDNYKIKTQS